MSNLTELAEQLSCGRAGCGCARRSGQNLSVHCPAHQDDKPSLSLTEESDGKLLWHCNAGCTQKDVLQALQERGSLSVAAGRLVTPGAPTPRKSLRRERSILSTYDYTDEAGTLLYQVLRYDPKGFSQRKPAGTTGMWTYSLEGTRRVLYHLPEVVAAVQQGKPVYLTEGEKDADALRALGLCATCNPMGAGKWEDAYTEALAGANVVILPDNDDAGRAHARRVAAALYGKAKRIRVVELPALPDKGDVSDWLDAGGVGADLLKLVKEAVDWTPESAPTTVAELQPSSPKGPKRMTIAERVIDLADVGPPGDAPLLFGPYLLKGAAHWLTGQTGIGKSTFVYNLACALAEGKPLWGIGCEQTRVLYLDLESGDTGRALKLERLYLDAPRVRDHLFFLREALQFPQELADLLAFVSAQSIGLVIFDTARRCFSVKDENDNAEVYNRIVPVLDGLKAAGVATLTLGHPAKNGNGSARGAGAQEDAGDVNLSLTMYSGEVSADNGIVALKVMKNRILGLGQPPLLLKRLGKDRFEPEGDTGGFQDADGVEGQREQKRGEKARSAITDMLKGGAAKYGEIVGRLQGDGHKLSTVKTALSGLFKQGDVEKDSGGCYRLSDPFAED